VKQPQLSRFYKDALYRVYQRPLLVELGGPNGETIDRDRLDSNFPQPISDKAVAVIGLLQGDIGDGGKFGAESSFGMDVSGGVSEFLGVAWRSRNGQGVHEAARHCGGS
jgi:hypothetical protein